LSTDQLGRWKVRKHEFLPQGVTGADQKATAAEETPLPSTGEMDTSIAGIRSTLIYSALFSVLGVIYFD
jgi:hypothetical protein